ncbi:PAS domain S-box protein [Pseudomonas sp. PDM14]|uniref:two-component system sensor histidine kinase NtrB n=1 Tax=Pseudomonas sp. PDM14 TaxID=2769288 RepID=UPI001786750E|nr:PAS domain S-box protein [Pseudomonas sp. PDM14]MBD9485243.1 PAS domain S-box protein [Pseudomonas sp. PDM14]
MHANAPLKSRALTEHSYELLVQAVVDYAIYMLDTDGRIVSWNTGAQHIKGYSADEAIGQHLSMFFTPEDRINGKPQMLIETAIREGRSQNEGWRLRKDGTQFWALGVLDAIYDENGTVIGLAKITRDMTERHESQLHMETMRAQLFQAQKMEALGQLTGGMAHDFNNLLTVIIGASAMALRNPSPERLNSLLESIHDAGMRGSQLTGHLLTFARRRDPDNQAVDLNETLVSARRFLSQALPKKTQLDIALGEQLHMVEVDSSQLELALLNLIFNARDAMENGGVILLRAQNRTLHGEWDDLHGEFVEVSISDSGPGIDGPTLERIFEPFFTTKRFGKGTGLGLSQVYGFVKGCKGSIRVDSLVGQGTTMILYLPASRRGHS